MSMPRPNGKGATDRVSVPCGNCPSCLTRRRAGWALRLSEHEKDNPDSHFVTLTYSDKNLPFVYTDSEVGIPILEKSHLRDFLKRLRYYLGSDRIKYYAVGEYGTKTHRPHYHIIFFGIPREKEKFISVAWEFGFTYLGRVTPRSINYVAGYIITKRYDPHDIVPQFSVMSKGLGANYVEKYREYHQETGNHFATLPGGIKVSLPRYYSERIFSDLARENHKAEVAVIIDRKKQEFHDKCVSQGENPAVALEAIREQYRQRIRNKSLKNRNL